MPLFVIPCPEHKFNLSLTLLADFNDCCGLTDKYNFFNILILNTRPNMPLLCTVSVSSIHSLVHRKQRIYSLLVSVL